MKFPILAASALTLALSGAPSFAKTTKAKPKVAAKKAAAKSATAKPKLVKPKLVKPKLVKPKPAPLSPIPITIIGNRANWKKTPLVEAFWGGLVSIENGALAFTYLDGHTESAVGADNNYPNAIDIQAVGDQLFILDGTTLFRVTQNDSRRRRVGLLGAAPVMRFLANYDGELWGIEADGTLHRADANGVWTTVGAPGGWENVTQFFGFKGQLFTVDKGTLYRCDRELVWRQVGAIGEWRAINFMVPARNRIWMTGNSNMISVDATGRKTLIGKGRWPRLDALVALNGNLVSVNSSGQIAITTTR